MTLTFHRREVKSQLSAGDVVVVRIGRSGEAAVVPKSLGEANCGGLVIAKQPLAATSEYLAWYFNSVPGQSQLLEEVRGVTRQTLNTKSIARAVVPLAPFAEQRRIVETIDTLLGQVNAARDRLAKVRSIVGRFRQSVLVAACSGKLTEEWRTGRAGPLSREWVVEDDLDGVLPDLPASWLKVAFGTVIVDSFYGPRFGAAEYSDSGVPTVRTTDMDFQGNVTTQGSPRVAVSLSEMERFALREGDLLVSRTGTIGKCAVYSATLGPAIPSAYLIRLRVAQDHVDPRFALMFLQSPFGQRLFGTGQTSVAQPNVNARAIRAFPFPLAPKEEQTAAVAVAAELLTRADTIEGHVAAASGRAHALTQSILAKAFRGELVKTEAELAGAEGRDYEPAEALLTRIQTGRAVKLPTLEDRPARRVGTRSRQTK